MKRIFLSLTIVITFLLYSYHEQTDGSQSTPIIQPAPQQSSAPTASANTSPGSSAIAATPIPATTSNGSFKDGRYDGNSIDAFYGNVQVRITVASGKITDVQFLDYPQDRRTSQEINTQATPLLKQEAIQAQSASVDIVSGATQTSLAFQKSLQSALTKAKS